MSVEEKVREEEEQDSDEYINRAAASGISPMNLERAFSNFCKLNLFRQKKKNYNYYYYANLQPT